MNSSGLIVITKDEIVVVWFFLNYQQFSRCITISDSTCKTRTLSVFSGLYLWEMDAMARGGGK